MKTGVMLKFSRTKPLKSVCPGVRDFYKCSALACLRFHDIYECSSPLLPQVMGVLTN